MAKVLSLTSLICYCLVAAIHLATAYCPTYSSRRLEPPSGSITFRERYRTGRACRWSFPALKAVDHVVMMKLTSSSLIRRQCLGTLELPDVSSFCDKPTNTCFIYASFPTCSREMAFDFLRNETCSESYWILNKSTRRYIQFYSRLSTSKSFSFDYKYFSCLEYLNRTQSASRAGEGQNGPVKAPGVSFGTLGGVVVLFIILLLTSLTLLVLLYRRFQKLKRESKPRRVQYELSKQNDISISAPVNVEAASNSASRDESNLALHGQHHSTYLHENNDTSYQDATAELNYDYSAAVDYGADVNQDYNSFTSDESDQHHHTENDQVREYSVVNKDRL